MGMKIAFYKGLSLPLNLVDLATCLVTLSRYSHCELVFSDGLSAAASIRDLKVRFKHIEYTSSRWDTFELKDSNLEELSARSIYNLYEGCRYSLSLTSRADEFSNAELCSIALGLPTCASTQQVYHLLKTSGRI